MAAGAYESSNPCCRVPLLLDRLQARLDLRNSAEVMRVLCAVTSSRRDPLALDQLISFRSQHLAFVNRGSLWFIWFLHLIFCRLSHPLVLSHLLRASYPIEFCAILALFRVFASHAYTSTSKGRFLRCSRLR